MNFTVDPDWSGTTATSESGAGPLGFAGTVPKSRSAATGLVTLENDEFGGRAVLPMVPGTWNVDPDGEVDGGDSR